MMERIRVIHLLEELKVGGLERVIAMIAESLPKEKYCVEVWAISRGGSMREELASQGIIVRVLNIPSYYNPFNIIRLAKHLKRFQPHIIHSHTYFSNTISRLAGRLAKVPVQIVHVHNIYSQYSSRNLWMERMLSHKTDQIIACSDAVRDFVIKKERVAPNKTVTIYNGIDIQKFSKVEEESLPRSTGVQETDVVLITIASLRPKKGHEYLFKAMAEVVKVFKNVKWLIVGEGPLKKELEELMKKLELSAYVKLLGQRKDTPQLLKLSDIFVLPSLTEGLPLVVIEAMMSGLPVVATSVGGTPEVVKDGQTGILVPPKDVKALVDAIVTLLNSSADARQMGEKGYKVSREEFSSETMIKNIESIYKDCLFRKTERKIPILYVHNKNQISGGEQSLLNLWDNLDQKQFKPYLALPEEGPFSEEARKLGVETFCLSVPSIHLGNILKLIKVMWLLGRYIRQHKIRIIHSYTPRNNIISSLVGKLLRVPVIWHERNLIFEDEQDMTRKYFFLPDRIICNSLAVAERFDIKEELVPKLKVILNGVNLKKFQPQDNNALMKEKLGFGNKKVVGVISNLNKRKRVDYFLKAAGSLVKKREDVHFVVVGGEFSDDGTKELEMLKREAENLGLKDRVTFTGFVENVGDYLMAFDVSVHVTLKEACSRAILESMAAGKPVIVMNDGGNPELVDNGVIGMLVNPEGLDDLVEAIDKLLTDDQRREEMGKKARKHAEKFFDVKRNARQTEAVYQELLNETRN